MKHVLAPYRILAGLVCCLAVAPPAHGQRLSGLSDEARLYLVTMWPGSGAHELFGHSAIRLHDPARGIDALFNYGTFQFDAFFLPKFIYGKLDYMLWVSGYQRELPRYRDRGRSVVEQELRLTPAQREDLVRFLETNWRQDPFYRYRFLDDNCSTRIRDALERTLGAGVRFDASYTEPASYRALLDQYVDHLPLLDLGFYLVLGQPADRLADGRDAMFLPLYLKAAFDAATVQTDSGWAPLVAATDTTYWNPAADVPPAGPWVPLTPVLWVLVGIASAATWRRRRASSPLLPVVDRLLFGVVGFAGLLMFFLWAIALHDVANQNWNLLWAWPTHLLAAFRLAKRPAWLAFYLWAAAAAGALTLLGWPFWPQELHPALIPVIALLALRSGWIAWWMRA